MRRCLHTALCVLIFFCAIILPGDVAAATTIEIQDKVLQIYAGVWETVPDSQGLGYWTSEIQSGHFTHVDVATSFFDQPLVQAKYAGAQGDALLEALYKNLFKIETPDTEGFAYWQGKIIADPSLMNDNIGTLIMQMIDGMWANPAAAVTQDLYANFTKAGHVFYDAQVANGMIYSELSLHEQYNFLASARELTAGLGAGVTDAEIDALVATAIQCIANVCKAADPDDDYDSDGYTENQGDCKDAVATIHPGATEICGDGIDQDCSGSDLVCPIMLNDIDNDGDGYTENQGDCNDFNASIYPDSTGTCINGGGIAPNVSNFYFSPSSAELSIPGAQTVVSISFDFYDPDGDVARIEALVLDGSYISEDISGPDEIIDGTISGDVLVRIDAVGVYPFELRVVDANGNASNSLYGAFEVLWPDAYDHDPTFGVDGMQLFEGQEDYTNEEGHALVIQPDGKIIVGGVQVQNALLLRYNVDATLDNTFATGGVLVFDGSNGDSYEDLALQSDGNIIAIGSTFEEVLIMRLLPNGTLDTTFGAQGITTTTIGYDATGYAGTLQDDGKIVVVGNASTIDGPNTDSVGFVARYNKNGSLDSTFGTGGMVVFDSLRGGWDTFYDVAIQGDGKILASGEASFPDALAFGDVLLLRLLADGTPDATFGDQGVVFFGERSQSSGRSLALQPDGKILVAGARYFGQVDPETPTLILRYNSSGTLDQTFGVAGVATAPGDSCVALALQSDGKIVGIGRYGNSALLVRFDQNGLLDKTFSGNGWGRYRYDSSGISMGVGADLAVQADGKIVGTGWSTFHDQSSDAAVYLFRVLPEMINPWP